MDAFFAAIEQLDHPEYRGKELVVGGNPQGRGVVSTASYEARKFGIKSAMPAAHARKLCPHAIFVRPRIDRYREISEMVMAIFHQHTNLVEQVSLDEAYLDVTEYRFGIDDPRMIAELIKQAIFARTKLTASAGVAPNMFLAKIASDMNKPNGLTVIEPEKIEDFLKDLPVRKIPGVGPVTEARLQQMNLRTCGDITGTPKNFLAEKFGKTGVFLYRRALGIDEREVEPDYEAKQSSSEETFAKDIVNVQWLKEKLKELAQEVFYDLSSQGKSGKTIVLKVKYYDFELITRSQTIKNIPGNWQEIHQIACTLLDQKTEAGKKPIRLLGVGVSGLKYLAEFQSKPSPQWELF